MILSYIRGIRYYCGYSSIQQLEVLHALLGCTPQSDGCGDNPGRVAVFLCESVSENTSNSRSIFAGPALVVQAGSSQFRRPYRCFNFSRYTCKPHPMLLRHQHLLVFLRCLSYKMAAPAPFWLLKLPDSQRRFSVPHLRCPTL